MVYISLIGSFRIPTFVTFAHLKPSFSMQLQNTFTVLVNHISENMISTFIPFLEPKGTQIQNAFHSSLYEVTRATEFR